MCRNILGYLLVCVFLFVVATIAAFVYLPWWQALAVSFVIFFALITLSKYLLRFFIKRLGRQAFRSMDSNSAVLDDATIDVHAIKPTTMPKTVTDEIKMLESYRDDSKDAPDDDGPAEYEKSIRDLNSRRWFQIEVSLFPKETKPEAAKDWVPASLQIVPFEAKAVSYESLLNADDSDDGTELDDETESFELHQMTLIENGVEQPNLDANEPVTGPQRFRFKVGIPANIRLVKFRYHAHDFGRIELPVIFPS
jgi:hypothetical protein